MKLNFRTAGSGHPVIILHGLFGSADNWQTFGKHLAGSGYKVIMADLRNHGLSPHADEFNITALADDVKELIEEEKFNNPIIIGHSLGGKTAMKFSFLYPELIKALIVIDIAPGYYPVHHLDVINAIDSVDTFNLKSRSEAEEILSLSLDDKAVVQWLLKSLYWKDKDHLKWRFNFPVLKNKIENTGENITSETPFSKPTMFIKGEKSNYIKHDDEKDILELFTNVEIKTAPHSGHWIQAENPEWLLATIVEFIKQRSN